MAWRCTTIIFAYIVQGMDTGRNGVCGFKGKHNVSACLVMVIETEEYMVSTELRVFPVKCHITVIATTMN